ncbi:MAG: ATP-grasp domain-containing protein [Bacillota bacterium]|nr:ATP-grasp domain-containing protein [Bacillota bacterium]
MIILDEPYVSDFLVDTLIKNQVPVLKSPALKEINTENMLLLGEQDFFAHYQFNADLPLYTNSENTIALVMQYLSETSIAQTTKVLKDKYIFRQATQSLYPGLQFSKKNIEDLSSLEEENLTYPIIVKPSTGFFSMGVYKVNKPEEWPDIINQLREEQTQASGLYPDCVISYVDYIVEQFIPGTEFAVDAYYNQEGEPIILNILEHLFLDDNDTRDRVYFTSKATIEKWLSVFQQELTRIGQTLTIKNYPVHVEFRVSNGQVLPIEVNPLRFAGWCTTDIAFYAWGINPYEYYLLGKAPNWNELLDKKDDGYDCINVADISPQINRQTIKSIRYDEFAKLFSKVHELRKIDYHKHPVFSFVFSHTDSYEEMRQIIMQDFTPYLELD